MSPHRLRIAFVIDDLGHGGAQRQLSTLVAALAETVEPQVYCLSEITRPFADTIRAAGVRVVTMRRSRGFDLGRLRSLTHEISSGEVDVVHGFLDAANLYAYLAARRARTPCVLSLRNEVLRLGGFRGWCLRRALRRADWVVTNSRAGARFLTDSVLVDPGRTTVVPNAVASHRGDSAPDLAPPQPPVIGFVGRLVEQKQPDLLLDAYAILLERVPDAMLVLVGDGPRRQPLLDRIHRLGVADGVTMTGAVDNVERYMREFSCLVLPSVFEGFPNVVMEALSLGIPVVACPVGDLEDVVLEGRTGRLIREDTPTALAFLLSQVIEDEPLRRSAAEEGPALIRTQYSVAAATDKLLAVYNRLTSTEPSPRP